MEPGRLGITPLTARFPPHDSVMTETREDRRVFMQRRRLMAETGQVPPYSQCFSDKGGDQRPDGERHACTTCFDTDGLARKKRL
jgi:hypothetical protein